MTDDYRAAVLETYLKLKDGNKLSHNMANPTPANLRNEAAALYNKNKEANGAEILKEFTVDGNRKYDAEIATTLDIDKFRPVSHYLLGQKSKSNPRVVELVAWLIDFNPRPYEVWKKANSNESKRNGGGENGGKIQKMRFGKIEVIMFLMVVGVIFAGAYWFDRDQKCMYWTGTEYKAVNCNEKIPQVTVIALDQKKLENFKKITKPDTITLNSVGKIWYSKIDNKVEFFTSRGMHPVKSYRILKPLSIHVWETYAVPNKP
jgi:hypothetical protein